MNRELTVDFSQNKRCDSCDSLMTISVYDETPLALKSGLRLFCIRCALKRHNGKKLDKKSMIKTTEQEIQEFLIELRGIEVK